LHEEDNRQDHPFLPVGEREAKLIVAVLFGDFIFVVCTIFLVVLAVSLAAGMRGRVLCMLVLEVGARILLLRKSSLVVSDCIRVVDLALLCGGSHDGWGYY
jgi:hypothetical protein